MSALSDFAENKIIDWWLRGQTYAPPATVYVGLFTALETDSGGGTEVTGSGYARQAITSALTSWAGTQASGSTAVSSGTSGTTSNNSAIVFSGPVGAVVVGFGVFDAATAGNLLFYAPLTTAKTLGSDGATFAAAALSLQIDN